MSVQITTAFVEQYKSNVFHLAQQKGSRLRDAARTETVTGKAHFFERIGSTAAQKRHHVMLILHVWIHHIPDVKCHLMIMTGQILLTKKIK